MTDSGSQPSDDELRWARLTEKQRACLDLLLEHRTSKQIARQLNISKQAVDLRLTTARDILGAENRADTAIRYARLKQTYDRMPWDTIIVAANLDRMSSGFPDEGPAALALTDSVSIAVDPVVTGSPSKGLWRRNHSRPSRIWIMAAMLAVLLLLTLAALTIGETLTRLISG